MATVEENIALVHQHAVHEHRRELPQLLGTVSEDAVYEDVARGLRWDGKKNVERFYLELLRAFPDIDFQLLHRRGGPEHVVEELVATATHLGPLSGPDGQRSIAATGKKVTFRLCIVFPVRGKEITGEVVYYDLLGIYRQIGVLPPGL